MRFLISLLLVAVPVCSQSALQPVRLGVVAYEDESEGMVVEVVRKGSPASAAGLVPGDRIIKLGDLPIRKDSDLVRALEGLRPGHTARLVVLRKGKETPLDVKFAAVRAEADPLEEAKAGIDRAMESLLEHADLPGVKKALKELSLAQVALSRAGSRTRKRTVGAAGAIDFSGLQDRVRELMSTGATPGEIQEIIAEEFPGAQVRIQTGGGDPEMGREVEEEEVEEAFPPAKKKAKNPDEKSGKKSAGSSGK